MRVIRYQDRQGHIGYAAQNETNTAMKIVGSIFDSPEVTSEAVQVQKLLAPIEPVDSLLDHVTLDAPAPDTPGSEPAGSDGEPSDDEDDVWP